MASSGQVIDRSFADARDSLRLREFALPVADAGASFAGGIVRGGKLNGEARGALENDPHADMHGAIGGLMGRFATAALDPIFWLHHCNIDRLWEVWRGLGNRNSNESDWLGTKFKLYDVTGATIEQAIGGVLETTDIGYGYESTDPPADFEPIVAVELPEARPEVPMPSPELVGASTDVSFAEPTTVSVDLVEPERPALEGVAGRERWFLRAEGVRGDLPDAAAFAVYLESPMRGEEPVIVGTIGAFGIEEASRADEMNDGTGITDVFDITEHVRALEASGAWDSTRARVRIVPMDAAGQPASGGNVRARRVSFYRG